MLSPARCAALTTLVDERGLGALSLHGVTADAAFSVLSRVSQAENLKLTEVARGFAESGRRPGLPGPEAVRLAR